MPVAGIDAILRGIERRQGQPEVCYEIARELRSEINSLHAAMFGPAVSRPRKKERDRREAHINGMKTALGLALGIPPDLHSESLDKFLDDFRQERLKAIQNGSDERAERQRKALAAERGRIVGLSAKEPT